MFYYSPPLVKVNKQMVLGQKKKKREATKHPTLCHGHTIYERDDVMVATTQTVFFYENNKSKNFENQTNKTKERKNQA